MQTRGLTLIEIVVVVAILAALAALVLPRLESTLNSSRSCACASDMAAVERSIIVYKSNNLEGQLRYPGNWDSLLPSGPSTPLEPTLSSLLTPHPLTGSEATIILNAFEVGNHFDDTVHVFVRDLDTAASLPSDAYSIPRQIVSGGNVSEVDFTNGIKIWQSAFSGVTSAELSQRHSNGFLIAFGVGPNSDMSANSKKSNVFAVPIFPGLDPSLYYERYIAVFYLDRVNATIELKTVIGADGKTPQQSQADFRTGN